jgi:elongation factor G
MTVKSEYAGHRAPPWLIEIAIEPSLMVDQQKLGVALATLVADEPTLAVATDHESGQTILKGMDESHLDASIDSLRRICGFNVRVGAPQVAFRERPTRRVEVEYIHKKTYGPKGEFAAVKIVVAPNAPGAGYVFISKISDSVVPEEYIPGVEKGLSSVLTSGVVAGFPVVDLKVELVDGKYHDVDSSVRAFEVASRAAFREALQKAGSVLLEPIMKVEVMTPEDCIGAIIGDLNRRRGRIQGQDMRGNASLIAATVPLMKMFGHVPALRAVSRGRATFAMQFDHYAPAPPNDNGPPFRPAVGMRA